MIKTLSSSGRYHILTKIDKYILLLKGSMCDLITKYLATFSLLLKKEKYTCVNYTWFIILLYFGFVNDFFDKTKQNDITWC